MNNLKIALPCLSMKSAYLNFIKAYLLDEQSSYSAPKEMFHSTLGNVEDMINLELAHSRGEKLPPDWAPATTLWLCLENLIIGESVIRHHLNNDVLKNYAGNVTYYILPAFRGNGRGKFLLRKTMSAAKSLGFNSLMLCCDQTNHPSIRTLKACGAVLMDVLDNKENWGEMTCRYNLSTHSGYVVR